MDKIPIEIFVAEQLSQDRYRNIIAQLRVDHRLVSMTLINFFREQGIYFVSSSLASELSTIIATELAAKNGLSGVAPRVLKYRR